MPAERRLANPVETEQILTMSTAIGNVFFAGEKPQIISAVLAELMSTLLLNHRIPSDRKRETELREEILATWLETVRALVAVQTDPPATETMQ